MNEYIIPLGSVVVRDRPTAAINEFFKREFELFVTEEKNLSSIIKSKGKKP
jgi:hypothetical protein